MTKARHEPGGTSLRRFKRYPEYKDSGVDWLGKVPAHWEVKFFKALLSKNDSGVWGEDFDDDGVVVLRSTEQTVDGRWRIQDPARRRLSVREASNSRLVVGDLVTTKSSGSDLHIGKTSIVDESVAALTCCFSNFMQRLRVAPLHEPRYYWYLLNCPVLREQLVFLSSTTTGLGNLNGSILGALRVPLAPEAEQRTIATFLDRETARIDGLVAKKERLIGLLQEKRAALITRAVTKGLDQSLPMRDSGVEWLGEIPAHWEVMKTTWLFSIGSGTTPRSDDPGYYGGETPWITTSELRESVVLSTEKNVTEEALKEHSSLKVHPKGSIAVAMYGATIGRLGILGVPAAVNQACCVFSNPRRIETWFWFYWLQMRRPHLVSLGYGGGQPNLSQDLLRSIRVPTPPLSEQEAITAFLDRETGRIDALVVKIRDAIDRLKELRTALISAAVTGKIDVRAA